MKRSIYSIALLSMLLVCAQLGIAQNNDSETKPRTETKEDDASKNEEGPEKEDDNSGSVDGDQDEEDNAPPRLNWRYDIGNEASFEAIVFSDLAGVQSDQPNGLIQTESRFETPILHSFPWRKTYKYRQASDESPAMVRRILFLRNTVFDLQTSKIESDDRNLMLRKYESRDASDTAMVYGVNTLDALQYSNLRIDARVNLFNFQSYVHLKKPDPETSSDGDDAESAEAFYGDDAALEEAKKEFNSTKASEAFERHHSFSIDAMIGYLRNSVSDTNVTFLDKEPTRIYNTFTWGGSADWTYAQIDSRLSMTLSYQFRILSEPKRSQIILQDRTEVPLLLVNEENYYSRPLYNTGRSAALDNRLTSNIQIQFKLKNKGEDAKGSSFLRFGWYSDSWMPFVADNHFFQAQVGVSTTFDDLFKKKEEDNDQ